MPPLVTASEYVKVGDYPLATPAGRLTDLSPLWSIATRGRNVLIPGQAGVIGTPRRRTETTIALPGVVFGDLKNDGTPHIGTRAGLTENLDELIGQVVEPVTTGDGARTWTWYRGNGSTVTCRVQTDRFEIRSIGPTAIRYTLTVTALDAWQQEEETP